MDNLQNTPVTQNLSNAGLVAGTTNTLTSTATTSCAILGKFGTTLGAMTNSATTPVVDATTGLAFTPMVANQACALVFGVNAAGAIKMSQGPITPTEVGVTTTPGNFLVAPQFPSLPDDFCPLAYTLVRTSPTGNAFTPGTTAWAASGIVCSTFKNVSTLPARPQTS